LIEAFSIIFSSTRVTLLPVSALIMKDNEAESIEPKLPPHRHRPHGRHFIHPSGKTIRIAATPEEHRRLTLELSQSHTNEAFDVFVHGSPEHV
jgi:hypothetical protein